MLPPALTNAGDGALCRRPTILGILNLTQDSFSDGGRYLSTDAALEQAHRLVADGADIVDCGAESSHPDSAAVPPAEQVARLTPVVRALRAAGVAVSVDAYAPAVIEAMLACGVPWINDITALADPAAARLVARSDSRALLMHSLSADPRAARITAPPGDIVHHIRQFFADRLDTLAALGLPRERLVLDPGMGFFLGSAPQTSVEVLRRLPELARLGCPLAVCVSRKSFIGALLADSAGPRPIGQRAAGTLAAELWAVAHGAAFIRTHEPRPLRDALATLAALQPPAA